MKHISQIATIMGVSFLGEMLYKFLGLPIPASIYGLILMLMLLETKVVKFEKIKDTGTFILNIMILTLQGQLAFDIQF